MTKIVPTPLAKQNPSDAASAYFSGRYPGYQLHSYETDSETGALKCFILKPLHNGVICPNCHAYCNRWKDKDRTISVTDTDGASGEVITVVIPSRRMRCRCGCQQTEPRPSWVLPGHLITKHLAVKIQALLRHRITTKDVASITGVDWGLVKKLDMANLELCHGEEKDLTHVRHLAIDEISIHKGHKYATVVMDLDDRAIVHVVQGKRQTDMKPFFERLQAEGLDKQIQSVSVDMNAAYPRLVSEFLPNTRLAYDRFHVMQQLNRQVLMEARKHAINKVRTEFKSLAPKERKMLGNITRRNIAIEVVKSAEWLVITDSELLSPDRQEKLRQLREHNQLFADLYTFTAKFKTVWGASNEQESRSLLNECIELCQAIGEAHDFKPILAFGRMLQRRATGIINACVVRYGTNILEGANNTAKVIKRVAYGFRDFKYFSLKLKAAFPGKRHLSNVPSRAVSLAWDRSWEMLSFPHFS